MDQERVQITFDDQSKIRVLDQSKFEKTQQLATEATDFVTKTAEFTNTVSSILQILEAQAKRIEQEKLRAIGQRNNMESEGETRKRKQRELLARVNESQAELQRLTAQYDSLCKTEAEQKTLIDKLCENNA